MSNNFPSYSGLFKSTKRRLLKLEKIAQKRNAKLSDEDSFLFLIVGNINLRINTMFHLMESGIIDGVYPLQRTLFEMQLAFEAYSLADDKQRFLKLYFDKKNLESFRKVEKLIKADSLYSQIRFNDEEKLLASKYMEEATEAVKSIAGPKVNKTWYELASNKSVYELSKEYNSELEYFLCYDEPSNWVHPQRLDQSMGTNFDFYIQPAYFTFIIGSLRYSIKYLVDDIAFIAEKIEIVESDPLYKYGEAMGKFDLKLQKLILG
ncbi:DUF5677 domain-containing protein [Enterococcus faecium]|uniref:DUF5677 domain-containing protein n=1 Tax=Enterococcus faecium TaxID=1352 RepID=UPI003CE59081